MTLLVSVFTAESRRFWPAPSVERALEIEASSVSTAASTPLAVPAVETS